MPGKAISRTFWQLIVRYLLDLNKTSLQIYEDIFQGNVSSGITFKYLDALCKRLVSDAVFREHYLSGPQKTTGRPRTNDAHARNFILDIVVEKKNFKIRKLRSHFNTYYHGSLPGDPSPIGSSKSTLLRVIHRADFSRKVMERSHFLRNDLDGVDYLHRIQHIDPLDLIDIDETASSPQSFLDRYGWAPTGQECVKLQITIGSKSFSTIAALSPLGYLAWEIFEGSITHAEFSSFLTNNLRLPLTNTSFGILDNASIHRASRLALQETFGEEYQFCPQYSPNLKPIETCFAMVKEDIRNHDDGGTLRLSPQQLIHNAFLKFSVGQEKARAVYHHWDAYFNNHANYLEEIA